MKINIIIFIFLIFYLKIKSIYSIDIVLTIDINSKINYEQFQCGGSLKIIDNNGTKIIDNEQQYPPCKSIEDAANRTRNFNFENNEKSNITIILEFVNLNWENQTVKDGVYFGDLLFCGFEIRVKDEPNAIITIDGGGFVNNYGWFLYFNSSSSNNGICDSSQNTRINLRNIKFQNWNNNVIVFWNHIEDLPQILEFNSIQTVSVSNFLNAYTYKSQYSSIYVYINDCKFSNSTSLSAFISSYGYIEFNNCSFTNMNIEYYLIVIYGNGILYNNHINNLTMPNSITIIKTYYGITKMIQNYIENSIFPTIYINIKKIIQFENNFIQNLILRNNSINKNTDYSYLFEISNSLNEQVLITTFENVDIDSSNSIENNINFAKSIGKNKIRLNNTSTINFSSFLKLNDSTIDIIDKSFNLQSKTFINGQNNIINLYDIDDKKMDQFRFQLIKNGCFNCKFRFLINNHTILTLPQKSSNIIENDNKTNQHQTINYNYTHHYDKGYVAIQPNDTKSTSKDYKVLIIGVTIGCFIFVVFILTIIILKNKLQKGKSKNNEKLILK